MTAFQRDVERALNDMLNEKHAPVLIPRVTIDAASTAFTIVAAGFDNLKLPNSGNTSSASLTTLLTYTGRGVLQKLVIVEKTSGGAAANAIALKITVDGNVVLNDASFIPTQMQLRAAVGSLVMRSTSDVEVHDDSIGLPFNSSILIEYSTAAGTIHGGWKLSKKL